VKTVAVIAAALALSAGAAAAAAPDWASLGLTAYEPARPAPELGLPDLDGRVRTLADLRGKVTLVVFWATW
jgi:cytochrome oxidase Cu insertion factor (SCO1/SenC/PrrC family)